ncbi:MFS transporter [Tatumella sp. UBA2305]|uniref:MFS transporter n=1 Tax=Tatumella sp. UBA2305 TaxID=1947647 RepID=UPI0025E84DC1|nr:MFS transporter [Tatumella sp. UBA2305]
MMSGVVIDCSEKDIELETKKPARFVLTSAIGQILEWYDFFLYGTAAALVFGDLFFPVSKNPLAGTIAAYASLALGFVARPLGGVICGYLGDKYGRKKVMTATIALMGLSTFIMGLLPNYQQIGIAAPVILITLRMIQGLAVGGEWSGSILVISENTHRSKRGFFSAMSPCGSVMGFVLSSGVFIFSQAVSGTAFNQWGWRIPFLLSIVLTIIGLYLRFTLKESADFEAIKRQDKVEKSPLIAAIKQHPKAILTVFGLRLGEGCASWIFFAFSIAYGKYLGLSGDFILSSLTLSMFTMIPFSLLAGYMTDKYGRKTIYLAGSILALLYAYPFFLLLDTKQPGLVILALILANGVILGLLEGAQPAFISELFPANIRYSGIGLGREISSVIGAGLAPLIATSLLATFNSAIPIAIYLGFMVLVTVITTLLAPETYTRQQRLQDKRLLEN